MSHHQTTALKILDNLTAELTRATIDENWKHRVGRQTTLRLRFDDPDLVIRQAGNYLIVSTRGQEFTVGALSTDDEIAAAIQAPQTEKPKMPSPLQGVGQKLGLLKHSAEQHAAKISARVDALSARMDNAAAKTNQGLDAQEKDIGDVEAFAADLEKSNGGPDL